MKDWIDKNFDLLVRKKLLASKGQSHLLTFSGWEEAIVELCADNFIDVEVLSTEIKAGEKEAINLRITSAARRWLRRQRALSGTPKHILIALLSGYSAFAAEYPER